MNAAAFYILGAVVVAGSLAAVGLPRLRYAAGGLLALTSGAGILAIAAGAYFTGIVEVLVPALTVAGLAVALRRDGYLALGAPPSWSLRSLAVAGGVAAAFAAMLLVAFTGNATRWHSGTGTGALITLLHYRAPFALVVALIAIVVGVSGALLVGRIGEDEREFDRTLDARRQRDERAQRRRQEREAARRRRASSARETS